jgi:hypothetical protein
MVMEEHTMISMVCSSSIILSISNVDGPSVQWLERSGAFLPEHIRDQVDAIYFMGFAAKPDILLLNRQPKGLLPLLVSVF